jgi:hypothetical protein
VPFFDEVRSVPRPKATLTWVGKPHVQKILRALACSEVPLTHEGLSTLSPWRSVAHIRDLLMHTSVLPLRDRHLLLFERRLSEWLDTIKDVEHRQLLNRFATWHLLRKLRATAAKRRLGPGPSDPPAPSSSRQPPSSPGSPNGTAPSASAPRPTPTPGSPRTPPPAASSKRSCAGA